MLLKRAIEALNAPRFIKFLCLITDTWHYNYSMKKCSAHKIKKQLSRELKHRAWLEKNLSDTIILKNSKKRELELYTELTFKNVK